MTDIGQHIINDSINGSEAAFRQIVGHYQQMLFSLCVKILCDEEEAKDATQETFIRVWTNLDSYDQTQKFSTWIYTIATRICLNILKKRKPLVPLVREDGIVRRYATDPDGIEVLENKELATIINRLTDGLSHKQKLVFVLCQLEGLATSEVQKITGLNALQIKANLYLARKAVKEQLKKHGYE